jgi:hypothetical protein
MIALFYIPYTYGLSESLHDRCKEYKIKAKGGQIGIRQIATTWEIFLPSTVESLRDDRY